MGLDARGWMLVAVSASLQAGGGLLWDGFAGADALDSSGQTKTICAVCESKLREDFNFATAKTQ